MATQVESNTSLLDTVKMVLAVLITIAGILAFYYFADYPLVYRALSMVVVIALALTMILTTTLGHELMKFVKESRVEVRKMVWPSRQETMQATLVVIALVFIVGMILWILDMALLWGIRTLTGQGG
jgi:preprotein translocase subunit SecE